MNPVVYGLLLLAAILIALSIRIVPESERFIVFVMGRYAGLRGPGLLLRVPAAGQQWHRVRIGDQAEMTGPDQARIEGVDVPAINASGARLGAKVLVTGFENEALQVEPDPEFSKRVSCPRCDHEFEV